MNKVIQLIVLFSSLLILCGHAQTPVASYNFFRDTVDVSGNGNDLSFSGSVISETDYDDCRRYLDMIDNGYMRKDQPILVLDTAFTVIFWMRTNDISTDQKIDGQAAPGTK